MLKRALTGIVLVTLLFTLSTSVEAARKVKDQSDTIDDFKKIEVVEPFFGTAHAYAVFAKIGKGGLGIGGAHGKGQMYVGGKVVGFTSMSDISIGLQAGGQSYAQVIFFENAASLEDFTSGNFEFKASASAVAVQASADASAGTEGAGSSASGTKTGDKSATGAKYQEGIAVFTMAKGGLMYAATIAGQKYTYDKIEDKK